MPRQRQVPDVALVLTALADGSEGDETSDSPIICQDLHPPSEEKLDKQRDYGLGSK